MSIAEQALILLDILPSKIKRSRVENFFNLDLVINASFSGAAARLELEEKPVDSLYTVASRMGRTNYEEHAKAEALLHALRQMRAKNATKPANAGRVLRGT
jgi:hypothetical protein